MGFRKIRAKKYNGIYEYYRDRDTDKKTISFYIAYRDLSGKVKKIKTDAKDRDEALEKLNAVKAEIIKKKKQLEIVNYELERKKHSKNLTLDEYTTIFHENRDNIDSKAEKAKYYNHISPLLGKHKLIQIDKEILKNFRQTLEAKKIPTPVVYKDHLNSTSERVIEERSLSPNTIKKILDYLRVILNHATDDSYIDVSPLDFNQYRSKSKREAEKRYIYGNTVLDSAKDEDGGRVLSDKELKILWNLDALRMNDRLFLFLKACYYLGARPDAIINLQVKHVDFDTGMVAIKAMKKGKAYRAQMSQELSHLMVQWIEKHHLRHNNYIFYPIQSYLRAGSEYEKERVKNIHAQYSGYRKALQNIFDPVFNVGLDPYDRKYRVNVYSMRRTAATKVYKKHGIVHAMRFLNHTDIKTTMHYLNIDDDSEVLIDAL
jgi:integrase